MAALWTDYEHNVLKNNLVDGVTLERMKELLAPRNDGAIEKQALKPQYGFRIETSTDDKIKRFYHGVARRHRESKKAKGEQEVTELISVASIPSEMIVGDTVINSEEPQLITSNIISNISAKDANDMAVKMLVDNGLDPMPQIVCYLSTHIMGGTL